MRLSAFFINVSAAAAMTATAPQRAISKIIQLHVSQLPSVGWPFPIGANTSMEYTRNALKTAFVSRLAIASPVAPDRSASHR